MKKFVYKFAVSAMVATSLLGPLQYVSAAPPIPWEVAVIKNQVINEMRSKWLEYSEELKRVNRESLLELLPNLYDRYNVLLRKHLHLACRDNAIFNQQYSGIVTFVHLHLANVSCFNNSYAFERRIKSGLDFLNIQDLKKLIITLRIANDFLDRYFGDSIVGDQQLSAQELI